MAGRTANSSPDGHELLWSPSAYAACEGEQIAQWLMEGDME